MQGHDVVTGYLSALGLESWVVQVFTVVLITALVGFVAGHLLKRLQRALDKTRTVWDNSLGNAIRAPLRALIWVIGLAFAVEIAQRESQSDAVIFEAVTPLRDVAIIAVIAWFLIRFIREAEANIVADKHSRGETFDRTTMDAIAKLLRLSVFITAALVALQTLGFSVSGVLAFGGIGGIAVGFAAKDLLSNFFGGLMVYLDRPFAVGDWIRSPDRNIEGVVEKIGWRQTLIRKFDTRPLYVPNSTFSTISVENPSRMENRQLYETIGVRYADAGAVAAIVEEVSEMLKSHADIASDKFMMVNFNAFAPSSLDFFIYCYTRTAGWAEYHRVKQDVLLRILGIIDSHGAEVAFPTSTVHIASGLPPAPAEPSTPGTLE